MGCTLPGIAEAEMTDQHTLFPPSPSLREASAEYWKAKYEALAAGVTDPQAVKAASLLVASAASIARQHQVPFRQVFTALMESMYHTGSTSARARSKKKKRK